VVRATTLLTRAHPCPARRSPRSCRESQSQAAAASDKPERYGAYLRALADEERAAASVELATRMRAAPGTGQSAAQTARS
jgi:hypothetical protein